MCQGGVADTQAHAGGAAGIRVVDDDRTTIGGAVHVHLHGIGVHRPRQAYGGEGVFRREGRGPAVGDDQRRVTGCGW